MVEEANRGIVYPLCSHFWDRFNRIATLICERWCEIMENKKWLKRDCGKGKRGTKPKKIREKEGGK